MALEARVIGPHLLSSRSQSINGSGIRRVFEIGATIPAAQKIDLSIGQPDFPVPQTIKDAAIRAIQEDRNGYPLTRGIVELREVIAEQIKRDLGWSIGGLPLNPSPSDPGVLVTSGTSGALLLSCMALLNAGDEIIIPDPWFVLYPYLATLSNGVAVKCPVYPDFRMTAERVEKLITPRTKMVLLNSPGNPGGVVASERECVDLLDLCKKRNLLLLSDEIYDEFTYDEFRTQPMASNPRKLMCPSPARLPGAQEHVLVVRGYGKTYGVTGWRLGYAVGPRWLVEEMTKLQQYVYVSSPHPLQWGVMKAFEVDMSGHVAEYQRRRDVVVRALSPHTSVPTPGGAFYAFPAVPERFGGENERGEKFFQAAVRHNVLVVPSRTFSARDTHFRLSYATPMEKLSRGLDVLAGLMEGKLT